MFVGSYKKKVEKYVELTTSNLQCEEQTESWSQKFTK